MDPNANRPTRRGIRSWHLVLAACAVFASAATAAATSGRIGRAADGGAPADRLWALNSDGLLFPIEPTPMCEFLNNFGEQRSRHRHEGTDIGARGPDPDTGYPGQEVYAVEDAVVYERDDVDDGSAGISVRIKAIDHDVQYRYFHLAAIAPDIVEGGAVRRGELLGWVGDTGNATPGGWHLHFEIRPGPDYRPVDPGPRLAIPSVCRIYGTIATTTTVATTSPDTSVPGTDPADTTPDTKPTETTLPGSSVPGTTPVTRPGR